MRVAVVVDIEIGQRLLIAANAHEAHQNEPFVVMRACCNLEHGQENFAQKHLQLRLELRLEALEQLKKKRQRQLEDHGNMRHAIL